MVLIYFLFFHFFLCQTCGNGVVEAGEECDDGNIWSGCSKSCKIEKNQFGKVVFSCEGEPSVCSFVPPVGIPRPVFGVSNTHYQFQGVSGYSDVGNGPFNYYVDNSGTCTDSSNEYGSQSSPRCTIPLDLPAGSVVEINGGSYSYNNYEGNKLGMTGTGTKETPIFIRGVNDPVFESRQVKIVGTHIIVEGITFKFVAYPQGLDFTGAHNALRNCDNPRDGSAVGVDSYTVVYNNKIWHMGKWDDTANENDFIGVSFASGTHDVWILDNVLSFLGGDSSASGHSARRTTSHYYIGRNEMYTNGENAVDTKEVTDMVISENKAYNFRGWSAGSGGSGTAFVTHYGSAGSSSGMSSKNIWFINNEIYDADTAFTSTGGSEDIFMVGNVMYNLNSTALRSWGCRDLYVVGNTIYDTNGGLDYFSASTTNNFYLENNIFLDLKSTEYVVLDDSQYRNRANIKKNIYFHSSISGLNIDGNCGDCISKDPKLINPSGHNFHIASDSPARNNATDSKVYAMFYIRFYEHYGYLGDENAADIKFDIEGKCMSDTGYDIGAFQFVDDTECKHKYKKKDKKDKGGIDAGTVVAIVVGSLAVVCFVVCFIIVVGLLLIFGGVIVLKRKNGDEINTPLKEV